MESLNPTCKKLIKKFQNKIFKTHEMCYGMSFFLFFFSCSGEWMCNDDDRDIQSLIQIFYINTGVQLLITKIKKEKTKV